MENKVPYDMLAKTPFSSGPPWSGSNILACQSTKIHRSSGPVRRMPDSVCKRRLLKWHAFAATMSATSPIRNRLADVTEKGVRQRRQSPFNMKDDAEDTDEALPDSHFQKLTGIGNDGRSEKKGLRHLDEPFTEGDIFENRLIGKPAESFEQCAADEEGLVAINDAASDTAEVVQERDQFQPPVVAGELVHEPSSLDTLVGFHLV